MSRLLLASSSPRRVELMGRLGEPFEVRDPGPVEEEGGPSRPLARARWAASAKALAVAAGNPGATIVGADTIISLGGRALGKPAGPEEARQMLRLLSGRTHAVFTAVHAVGPGGRQAGAWSRSLVTFRPLRDAEIEGYLGRGESLDKAGAYAIQGHGASLAAAVRGPLDNVIGLPLAVVRRLLREVR